MLLNDEGEDQKYQQQQQQRQAEITMTTTKSTTAAKDKTSMQLNKQTKNNISRQAFDGQ